MSSAPVFNQKKIDLVMFHNSLVPLRIRRIEG
jgi:hypothetical protein